MIRLFAFIREQLFTIQGVEYTILNGFIGTEIMRRLIGLAQYLSKWTNTKANLLTFAKNLIEDEMDITAFFCLRQHCKPKQSLV
jgi:hypothetical protein